MDQDQAIRVVSQSLTKIWNEDGDAPSLTDRFYLDELDIVELTMDIEQTLSEEGYEIHIPDCIIEECTGEDEDLNFTPQPLISYIMTNSRVKLDLSDQ